MKLQVLDAAGQPAETIDVDDAVFGVTPNEAVVHQTLLAQLAARRVGLANTRSRGEVAGSTKKSTPRYAMLDVIGAYALM